MQVTEHFVRMPMANEADDVRIDLGQKKGGRASCTKTTGQNLGRKEAKVRA